jgi:phage baseplate assembly protein W
VAIEIKIQSRSPAKPEGYVFKDLHLDLELQKANIKEEERFLYPPAASNDIKVDTDLAAVRNSVRNIFLTKKGQRFLFPEFGSDLTPFLFEPISDYRGELLGDFIISEIERWEPRVRINKVIVRPDPDNNEYGASIVFSVPELETKEATLQLQFNQNQQTVL